MQPGNKTLLCLSKDKTAMSTGSMEMKMVSEVELNNFLSDMQRKYFKALEENKTLQEEVIALRKVLRNLLIEAADMLEKKCELKERMDALEARINEDKEKQAKWAQANVNWSESLTKDIIDANKKN